MKTNTFLYFITFGLIISVLCGLVYIVAQQNLRQAANDPQIQVAEDIASTLARGVSIESFRDIESQGVDIVKSLAVYVIIFDDAGRPVVSSAKLGGETPSIPSGVFDYVKSHGQDRISWQPQNGVRGAIVVQKYEANGTTGYVLVGRSLREVEKRESQLTIEVGAAWLASIIIAFVMSIVLAISI